MYFNTEILVFVVILTDAIFHPVNSQVPNNAETLASLRQLQLQSAQLDPRYREIITANADMNTAGVNTGIPGSNVANVETWPGATSLNQGFETPAITGTNTNSQLSPQVKVPIHGGWSLWSAWAPCNVTCGSGFQRRSRDCTDPAPSNGGIDCYAHYEEFRVCELAPCTETRPDAQIYVTDPVLGPISHAEMSRTLAMMAREQREKTATQNISFVPDVMKQPSQVKSQISLQHSINGNPEQLLNQSTEVMPDTLMQEQQLTSQTMLEKLKVVNPEMYLALQKEPIAQMSLERLNQLILKFSPDQQNTPVQEIPLQQPNQPIQEIPLQQPNQPIQETSFQQFNQPMQETPFQEPYNPLLGLSLQGPNYQHSQETLNNHFAGMSLEQLNRLISQFPSKQQHLQTQEMPIDQLNQEITEIPLNQHNQSPLDIAIQSLNQSEPVIPLNQHNQSIPDMTVQHLNQPKQDITVQQLNMSVQAEQLNQANEQTSGITSNHQMSSLPNTSVEAVSEVQTQTPLSEPSPVMDQMAQMNLNSPQDIMSQIAKTNKDILQSLGQLQTINNVENVQNNTNMSSLSQEMQPSKPIASLDNILNIVGQVEQFTSNLPVANYSNPLDTFGSSNNVHTLANDIPASVSNVQQDNPMLQTVSSPDKVNTPSQNYPNQEPNRFADFQNLVMNKSLSELQTMVQKIKSAKVNGSASNVLNEGATPLSNDPQRNALPNTLKQTNTAKPTALKHPSNPDILSQALTKDNPNLSQFAATKQHPNMLTNESPITFGGPNLVQFPQTSSPQPANWTIWSDWSVCDKTCDSGIQTRTRTCDKPVGVNLGCKGDGQQMRGCTLQPCPVVTGGWSKWMPWGPCGTSCGYGKQVRSRVCNSPTPQQSAMLCQGEAYESKSCVMKECPVPGGWSNWGRWTPCDRTCGDGHAVRIRRCIRPVPAFGGKDCGGPRFERKVCNLKLCPVDGKWNVWSNWSPCPVSCGQARQTRARKCDAPAPANGGRNCLGKPSDMQLCTRPACPVDGAWNVWSSWAQCNATCGQGTQLRTRRCDVPPPANGGRPCLGNGEDTKICNRPSCPVDGVWNVWTQWTQCDVSCGQGTKMRSRTCDAPPPSFGGRNCLGNRDEKSVCNAGGCPVNGGWTEWTVWGKCDKLCDKGHKTRTRECANPRPINGGMPCNGSGAEKQPCFIRPCIVDGKWSAWSPWEQCDVTCGDGTRERTRACNNPAPGIGGLECEGFRRQMISCHLKACPVPISWAPWSAWGNCDAPCDIGLKRRERICNSTFIGQTGNKCIGDSSEYRVCLPGACSDGGWSAWNAWTSCSSSCDTGTRSRVRLCNSPTPSVVGKHCAGAPSQTESCKVKPCSGKVPSFTVETPTTIINGKLTFSNTIFNQGGDYSPSKGEFVCSQPGTYYFSSSLMKKRDFMRVDKVHCSIYKNNATVIYVGVDPTDDDTDKGNAQAHNSVVVHLNQGDVVSLQGCVSPPTYYMENWSSFTGFMIRPDL